MVTLKLTALKQRRDASAFSLVEVTFAIAIIAFALVPMFGLLPMGLNAFHKSIGTSVGAQIAQRVIGEAQATDFATLYNAVMVTGSSTFLPPRNFDDEGNEVTTLSTGKWVYSVRTKVEAPPSGIGSLACTGLLNVVVQVVADPAMKSGSSGLVTASPGLPVQTYTGIVSFNK